MSSSASKSKICFFFDKTNFRLEKRTELKSFIEILFKKEKKKLSSLNYIFCTDKRLLEIKRQYLKHEDYTDIITFDLSASDVTQGEIYISIDRVRENAKVLGLSFNSELHRVVFHGALHLCGYGDKTKAQLEEMRKKEDAYLSSYSKVAT